MVTNISPNREPYPRELLMDPNSNTQPDKNPINKH